MQLNRLTILGVGLLGGSIGLAVKSILNDVEIVGYGHRKESLQTAREYGAIDRAELDAGQAVRESDLVVLATPVGTFGQILEAIAPHLRAGAVVTDVGSTKRSIVELAGRILPETVHFLGSHPMAGSEKKGVEFARPDLFQNAVCILTPTGRTSPQAVKDLGKFWQSLGMRIVKLSPEEHDQLLADVSHLPHALAAALVLMQEEGGLELAGKGFLDTTRIAGGDGGLWRDILLDNRDNLRGSLSRLRQKLEELEKLLDRQRGRELAEWLDRAADRRQGVLQQKLREVNPD